MTVLSQSRIAAFQAEARQAGALHGRDLPWRRDTRPYTALVSEFMLQQTQVARVEPKFREFMAVFPDFESLAAAPQSAVLTAWLGLGYNRRARFLQAAARRIVEEHGGSLPEEQKALEALPGVGANTAGALRAYAFNQPAVFVETNIRTVFLHYFFPGQSDVADKDILALVAATLPTSEYREWYWALMDWGSFLKTTGNNVACARNYRKQSQFAGSRRQMRGELLRQLRTPMTWAGLQWRLPNDNRLAPALKGLIKDGLVTKRGRRFYLA